MTPARAEDVQFPALDGFRLRGTLARSPDAPAGLVLIASATGVPRRYYGPFSTFLGNAGLEVLAFDYRGIGDSRPRSLRGFEASLHDWGERDLGGAISWLTDRRPELPLLVVGHSVGGQVLGLAPNLDRVAAVLSVASQSGYWRLWSGVRQLQMGLYFHLLVPLAARVAGYLPMSLVGGEDLPRGVALEWARWSRQSDYVLSLDRLPRKDGRAEDRRWTEGYGRFDRPWRAYAFTDDTYAPRLAVERLLACYPRSRSELLEMSPDSVGQPIGHFGFFRPVFEPTLWLQAREWLLAAAAGARTGGAQADDLVHGSSTRRGPLGAEV